MSIYLPLYFLKSFNLNHLKFFAYWGGLIFFLIPFSVFYILPTYLFNDYIFIEKFQIAIPIIYGLSMLFYYLTALSKEFSNLIALFSMIEIVSIFLSLTIWSCLPIIIHLDISLLLENVIVNYCFILLIVILLKKNVSVSKKKYEDLLSIYSAEKNNTNFIDEYNLTNREKEIITYLAKGLTYKEIGDTLFISDRTVGKHVSNIYAKTGVNQKYDLLEKLNLGSLVS